ncbi:MAG: phosphoribosylformylglycinamidine synthase [Christensenellales bacterium]
MVYRIFVEKKEELAFEAQALTRELKQFAGITALTKARIINRYDAEGLTEAEFEAAIPTVFSEPQVDRVYQTLDIPAGDAVFVLEYLPGQFDQRADSAAQCIQMQTQGLRPRVSTARVYVLSGSLSEKEVETAKAYLLNPVESREASMDKPQSLEMVAEEPGKTPVLTGFRVMDQAGMAQLRAEEALAMDDDDLQVLIDYFQAEGRDPTLTELKVIDTYWSDHCRHTTFLTEITDVACDDPVIAKTLQDYMAARDFLARQKPFTLMDVATIAARVLDKQGKLPELENTEENNACTIRIQADTINGPEDWLLFFKNETHNHPTEIEPFGGAATCIGGAIRDPLSARAYVYAGMRVTGAADPTQDPRDTLPGKLPQRRICQEAAAGFASYGNQIGLATGCVREIYHPGYVAKRLEAGAVLGAARAAHVRRERPTPGDAVILVGGATGRDGCGGATGSSQAHTVESVDVCAAQVQKGNAPEERKLQRLFLNPEVSALIKRCNDFGAGGVSVAIGELAPGLDIDLGKVPVKYRGLSGTELAISESQERMAVVVVAEDAEKFIALSAQENLEATVVARVMAEPRLVMHWRGDTIVDISRAFLDSNGAKKRMNIEIETPMLAETKPVDSFRDELLALAGSLQGCSQQGLGERFDSTIGAATVLYPFGGKHQLTPPAAMVHRLPVPGGTDTASFMAFGFNPQLSEQSPYHGAYLAVVDSVARVVAAGASARDVYLSFQEFFPRPGSDPKRWGLPLAALLGAFRAQMELEAAAIGGKDSMSGSFEHLDVPPTLISFAVAHGSAQGAVSPEFKKPGSQVVWLRPRLGADGLPEAASQRQMFDTAHRLMKDKKALSAQPVGQGGAAYAVAMMAVGNGIGFRFADDWDKETLFDEAYGSLILEMAEGETAGELLGHTITAPSLCLGDESLALDAFLDIYHRKLEGVYPLQTSSAHQEAPRITSHQTAPKDPRIAKPRVLLPVFPGTNCELDTARAFEAAGAVADIFIIKNRTPHEVAQSIAEAARRIREAQIVLIPGGFSGGDEPDGSGKFITAFLRSAPVKEAVLDLIKSRQGLLGGICNGFQALVKVGLLPFGDILDADENSPTLTLNAIGRHQSKIIRSRVASKLSPWFHLHELGKSYTMPISNGEGRFLCGETLLKSLAENGQIAGQYADLQGNPSMDIHFNPGSSAWAVEALTSSDGLVMGRMGHAERMQEGLYLNVPTTGPDPMFKAAVAYYG